jgi:hypothetical protein
MTVIRTGVPQYMANLEAQRDVAIASAKAAKKRVAELEEALQSLVNCLPQSELEIMRECIGNTNTAVIGHWISNAKNALNRYKEV